jgi:hypothetical protein
MEKLSLISDFLAVISAIFSLFAWIQARQINQKMDQEKQRQSRHISVILRNGRRCVDLPIELHRAELTRAEILGRIGMIPTKEKGKRFVLEYLHEPEFLRRISEIIQGEGESTLEISCTEAELDQFDLDIM